MEEKWKKGGMESKYEQKNNMERKRSGKGPPYHFFPSSCCYSAAKPVDSWIVDMTTRNITLTC